MTYAINSKRRIWYESVPEVNSYVVYAGKKKRVFDSKTFMWETTISELRLSSYFGGINEPIQISSDVNDLSAMGFTNPKGGMDDGRKNKQGCRFSKCGYV